MPRWADHFVAITDEGTELDRARAPSGFRDLFINPSDIGGRYSALSFFGLVPAALMGQDVARARRLGAGDAGRRRAGHRRRAIANPAVALGLAMGAARARRPRQADADRCRRRSSRSASGSSS